MKPALSPKFTNYIGQLSACTARCTHFLPHQTHQHYVIGEGAADVAIAVADAQGLLALQRLRIRPPARPPRRVLLLVACLRPPGGAGAPSGALPGWHSSRHCCHRRWLPVARPTPFNGKHTHA